MLKRLLAFLFFFGMVGIFSAQAQLMLDLDLNNRRNFLQYEPILAHVKIRNDSAQPLLFGKDEMRGTMQFEIVDKRGCEVPTIGEMDYSLTGLLLKAGETKEITLQLNKFYKLEPLGLYQAQVYITHPKLKDAFRSRDVRFEVVKGNSEWRKTVGVPDISDSTNQGEKIIAERTFDIRSVIEGTTTNYYLLVEDPKTVYALHRLGIALAQEKFTVSVDRLSNLHILLPLNPKTFRYFVYDIDGKLCDMRSYRKTTTNPALYRDQELGTVRVLGGEEIIDQKPANTSMAQPAGNTNASTNTLLPAAQPAIPTAEPIE